MATQFATSGARSGAAPFLLSKGSEASLNVDFADALRAALIVEARGGRSRPERCRIAGLLCELASQLGARRTVDLDMEIPLSRAELATLLGLSLVRVKRALGLMTLSGVVETDGLSLRVTDWRRLCGMARFDSCRLGLAEEDEAASLAAADEQSHLFTAAGDPACFV